MRRRRAFTLVEMLVSLALIMFIMAIISEAFVASAKTFRDLKAAGDLADRLRVTTNTLRRMLYASHFGPNQNLSDPFFWQNGPPNYGFFRIFQGSQSAPEGGPGVGDTSMMLAAPTTIAPGGMTPAVPFPSNRVTNCSLHFTANLSGSNMNNYFYAFVPQNSPPGTSPLLQPLYSGDFPEGRYQDTGQTNPPYACQWAEVSFFLGPTPDTANGTPLFALYMRQRLLVPQTGLSQFSFTPAAPTSTTDYVEISAVNSGGTLLCNRPIDITTPPRRFAMNPFVTAPAGSSTNLSGQFANNGGVVGAGSYTTLATDTTGNALDTQRFAGADLLMTDVVSFEVRVLPQGWSEFASVFDMANATDSGGNLLWTLNNPAFYSPIVPARSGLPMVFDTWSQMKDLTYDYSQWSAGSATNGNFDAIPFGNNTTTNRGLPILTAIQITLRVWDLKTEMTRQVTVVVPL